MTGIILATHGQLATGLQSAVDVITGMGNQIEILQLHPNDHLDHFEENFLTLIGKYREDSCLVLVDMIGGSPYNIASKHLQTNDHYQIVTGVNLPMLLEILMAKDQLTLSELSELACQMSPGTIKGFNKNGEILNLEKECHTENSVNDTDEVGGQITFARVDHRLLHGQVVTKWSRLENVNTIIIVDDSLYKDEYMTEIYRNAAPLGMQVIVAPHQVVAYAYEHNTFPTGRVMLLFKDISTVQKAYQAGLKLDKLQLGGIPNDGNKKMIFTAVSLSKEDINILDEIHETGTEITLQVVPEEAGIDYTEALKRFNAKNK